MTSGLDLVREQLRVAAGEPLGYTQADVRFRGHAIEVRVNAEDPLQNFRPAPGTITAYREPAGLGIRVDAAATLRTTISADYDSMIAKLIVWAPTRREARARLERAIDDYEIGGVPTTLAFLKALNDIPSVAAADYGTATLEAFAELWSAQQPPPVPASATAGGSESAAPGAAATMRLEVNDKLFTVRLIDAPSAAPPAVRGALARPKRRAAERPSNGRAASGNDVVSPLHGVVVELPVEIGAEVARGQVVAIIEAMKMMNEIVAPRAGSVAAIHAAVGATVEAQAPLLTLSPLAEGD
jgi:acetyl-CoA/propionyl-CoA carboxylase biotin carboxyl carrier protein